MKSKTNLSLTMDENRTHWLINLPRGKHIWYPVEEEANANKIALWIAQYGSDCRRNGWKSGLITGSAITIAVCAVVGGSKLIHDFGKKKNQEETEKSEEEA